MNACANSRYVRKAAAQYPRVHVWRPKELNPRANANGFVGSNAARRKGCLCNYSIKNDNDAAWHRKVCVGVLVLMSSQ